MNLRALIIITMYAVSWPALSGELPSKLTKDLRDAIEEERLMSARCLETKQKFGDAAFGVDLQNGDIELNKWAGTLIKDIDKETGGSPVQVRVILLEQLHENGCLSLLKELNRKYGVLSKEEFIAAGKVSGEKPSALYTYSAQWSWLWPKTR